MNEKSPVLTVAEFCDRYRIDRASYYRNAKLGRMPPAIKVGGSTRILAEDEEAWLTKQRSAGLVQEAVR
jgi:predicted DNA-binding transcriptional regulator AlpA